MVIFHSYVKLPEGRQRFRVPLLFRRNHISFCEYEAICNHVAMGQSLRVPKKALSFAGLMIFYSKQLLRISETTQSLGDDFLENRTEV